MNYYEIRDRVPCSEIDALTVEAARVWLTRNGWKIGEDHTDVYGIRRTYYEHGDACLCLGSKNGVHLIDASRRMCELVTEGAALSGKRAHVVIAEIRAIAEWQRRCKEYVYPGEGKCGCWTCMPAEVDVWGHVFKRNPGCPTCENKWCPRATDHRNECTGSNEAGQVGSRYV